ncbi:MAG: bifunctional oligoribonuclease/PAP phosphatase NrnA [Candidatus Doudnabacteria bacterium]|nr:bifunctional oligoribonuclease/PAP phosphatase NrnA [Candidatus Doudnabacteria bacterium]
MSIKIQFKKAWALIDKSENIFLTTHEGTDGDDLGSLLALRRVLVKEGKRVSAGVRGGVPSSLLFLSGSEHVQDGFVPGQYDLVVTFGCNKMERTGTAELSRWPGNVINFDHHPDNTNFGTVNVIDPAASAVAELVYHFIKYREFSIDKDIATCLLTGIFSDTGGFKHANTTAEALEVSAELLKKGARIDKISIQLVGKKRPSTIKAWARALENTRFDSDKRMVFSVLTEEDLKEAGATDEDLDGFVELLNNIPQAKFALLLRQDGDIVKGSLRSEPHKGVDVSRIAQSFGGGGHKLASGFKIKGRLVKKGDVWNIDKSD